MKAGSLLFGALLMISFSSYANMSGKGHSGKRENWMQKQEAKMHKDKNKMKQEEGKEMNQDKSKMKK